MRLRSVSGHLYGQIYDQEKHTWVTPSSHNGEVKTQETVMVFKDCHQVMVLLKHGKEMKRIEVQSSYVNSYHLSSAVTEKLLGIQGTNFITGVGQM